MKERIVQGDKIMTVTTTVMVEEREVDYNDLLDCVQVERDDWCGAPWDNCDGYGHTITRLGYNHHEGLEESNSSVYWDRARCIIEFDYAAESGFEDDYRYYRANGASKQVAFERVAQLRRERMDQLVEWYSNGWEYWVVTAEYNDFDACSCGGIDDYDYADGEMRNELAVELAGILEDNDFVVTGKPPAFDPVVARRESAINLMKLRANMLVTKGR